MRLSPHLAGRDACWWTPAPADQTRERTLAKYCVARRSLVTTPFGSPPGGYTTSMRAWPIAACFVGPKVQDTDAPSRINSWYSGKHRAPGGNVQAVIRPDGVPIWVSDVAPGHRHDLTVARDAGVIGALNWAASQLDLTTLADSGYDGAGQGIKTPIKQPAGAKVPAPDNHATTTLHRATRCRGERGFALLTGRWRALQRVTISPRRIGELAQAALVLTRIENVQLRHSCCRVAGGSFTLRLSQNRA